MEEEIWKDVKGYEGLYKISSHGRILSDRKNTKYKSRIIKYCSPGWGYPSCSLSKDGKVNGFSIHVLMAINFLNFKPCGRPIVVDHIDGDKNNNKVSNLRIVTTQFNIKYGFRKDRGYRLL